MTPAHERLKNAKGARLRRASRDCRNRYKGHRR
jgi:hypothetical protein